MRLPIQIQTIVYKKKESEFEFLLLKRVPEKGDFWQPISGGLEEEETIIECLKRELKEETGIKKYNKILGPFYLYEYKNEEYAETQLPKTLDNKSVTIINFVFAVEVYSDAEITLEENTCKEHSEFKWCSFDETIKLLKWDKNKEAFKILKKILDEQI